MLGVHQQVVQHLVQVARVDGARFTAVKLGVGTRYRMPVPNVLFSHALQVLEDDMLLDGEDRLRWVGALPALVALNDSVNRATRRRHRRRRRGGRRRRGRRAGRRRRIGCAPAVEEQDVLLDGARVGHENAALAGGERAQAL